MSDTPAPAYDPDSTPNGLADTVGQDWQPSGVPIAPTPVGETFVGDDGKHRHVPVPVDDDGVATGSPVGLKLGQDEEEG